MRAVLLFAVFAASAVQPPAQQARASVRIVRPVRITKESWAALPRKQRREVVVVKDGQPVKLRLIEFE
jgi:hypothetical protein